MKEVYYEGLDVHKDSIQMAVLDSREKEPVLAKGLPNRAARIAKELVAYREEGEVQINSFTIVSGRRFALLRKKEKPLPKSSMKFEAAQEGF